MRLLHVGIVLLMVSGARGAVGSSLSVELQATLQSHPSVTGVCVDCAALLQKAGSATPFQNRVGDRGGVPAQTRAGRVTRGRAETASAGCSGVSRRRRRRRRRARPAGSVSSLAVNRQLLARRGWRAGTPDTLVDNGDFERASAPGVPDGIAPAVFKRDFAWVTADAGHALAFNADPEGHGPSFTTPWVAIEGGAAIPLRFPSSRGESGSAPALQADRVRLRQLSRRRRQNRCRGPACSARGWVTPPAGQAFSATVTAPQEARWANLQVSNGSKVPYSLCLDDVRIAPATLPQVSVAQAVGGQRVSLRVEDPSIRVSDLGSPTSPVWNGFQALTPRPSTPPRTASGSPPCSTRRAWIGGARSR